MASLDIVYAQPPINEVVYGVRFEPFANWRIPHVGAFWTTVRTEFPQLEHAPPLDIFDPASAFPLPRSWLINKEDDKLLQIQNARFYYNWRRRDGDYPSYEVLSAEFFKYFSAFNKYCVEQPKLGKVNITGFELTYINNIDGGDIWEFPAELDKVIPITKQFVSQDRLRNLVIVVGSDLPKEMGEFQTRINLATRGKENRREVILEFVGSGLPSGGALDNMTKWFAVTHNTIIQNFNTLASEEAKEKLWGKKYVA